MPQSGSNDDRQLRNDVINELGRELGPGFANIGVAAESGVVTLTGQVSGPDEKWNIERAVWRVPVVRAIAQEVVVRDEDSDAAMDAYRAAFQLPDLLNYLLARSAFSIAFIPVYERARLERGEAGAERLFATILGTVAVVAVALTAVLWWQAGPLTAHSRKTKWPARRSRTGHDVVAGDAGVPSRLT